MKGPGTKAGSSRLVETLRTRARSSALFLLLDYDGTLVSLRRHPREAVADGNLLELLHRLVGRPRQQVAVVSGRSLEDLETVLPFVAGLWRFGTHGGVGLAPDGGRFPTAPFGDAKVVLRDLEARLQGESWPEGAWLETKDLSLVLHYRQSGEQAAKEARASFRATVEKVDPSGRLRLLRGRKVLEAVPVGLHKGLAVEWLRRNVVGGGVVFVALGDDVTDERTFEALGEGDIAIRVGPEDRPSAAPWHLEGPEQVRSLFRQLIGEELVPEVEPAPGKEEA